METLINTAELCQIIYWCRWMSTYIPDFHRIMQPLHILLGKAYAQAGKRKKIVLKSIPLHKLSRGTEHKHVLASIQDSLRSAVKMAFPHLEKVVCVIDGEQCEVMSSGGNANRWGTPGKASRTVKTWATSILGANVQYSTKKLDDLQKRGIRRGSNI